MTDNDPMPPPDIDPAGLTELAPGVFVIPDRRVPLVPNVGIVLGNDAALVVDCGMGPVNGKRVLEVAQRVADNRRLILTLTHFHPEHGFGAQAFKGVAEIFYNLAQADELAVKGDPYLSMFRGFGAPVVSALEGTELVAPDRTWTGSRHVLDLGGRTVEFMTWGQAHTLADQVVWLPDVSILFTGDLAENRIFPIFPWFPPDDEDIDAARWRAAIAEMEAMNPETVVPGHGETGGPEILRAVGSYMDTIQERVKELSGGGMGVNDMVETLTSEMTAAHPDWDAPEWIGFAVRYHADKG
ncbi:MAG: MBL fold metallo-hydrolase [Pseudomonadota bacterium]